MTWAHIAHCDGSCRTFAVRLVGLCFAKIAEQCSRPSQGVDPFCVCCGYPSGTLFLCFLHCLKRCRHAVHHQRRPNLACRPAGNPNSVPPLGARRCFDARQGLSLITLPPAAIATLTAGLDAPSRERFEQGIHKLQAIAAKVLGGRGSRVYLGQSCYSQLSMMCYIRVGICLNNTSEERHWALGKQIV